MAREFSVNFLASIYFLYGFISNILFPIICIFWNLPTDFVCSLHIFGAIDSLYSFQFLHTSYMLEVWYTFLCDAQIFGNCGISVGLEYKFQLLLLSILFLFQ